MKLLYLLIAALVIFPLATAVNLHIDKPIRNLFTQTYNTSREYSMCLTYAEGTRDIYLLGYNHFSTGTRDNVSMWCNTGVILHSHPSDSSCYPSQIDIRSWNNYTKIVRKNNYLFIIQCNNRTMNIFSPKTNYTIADTYKLY